MVRQWKGGAGVNGLNQPKQTESWGKSWGHVQQIAPTFDYKNEVVVMVVGNGFTSEPCLTIYHTNGETMEGWSWCEWPDNPTRLNLGANLRGL